ncbi:MAG: hypothetical protein ACOX9C_08610 [Kiritimatiellia bacterium]|jgi:hypothetical protein
MKISVREVISEALFAPKPQNKFAVLIRQLVLLCIFAPSFIWILSDLVKNYNKGVKTAVFFDQVSIMANAADPLVLHRLAGSLQRIKNETEICFEHLETSQVKDVWGFPLIVENLNESKKVRLISYGKDGVIGGAGQNTDWEIDFDYSDGVVITVVSAPPGFAWHLSHKLHLVLPTEQWEILEETYDQNQYPQIFLRLNLKSFEGF